VPYSDLERGALFPEQRSERYARVLFQSLVVFRYFAFTPDVDDNGEIYARDTDDTNQTNLTNSIGSDEGAVWSPDSNKIAFMSDRDHNDEIYAMDANGPNPAKLTNNPANDSSPGWALAPPS